MLFSFIHGCDSNCSPFVLHCLIDNISPSKHLDNSSLPISHRCLLFTSSFMHNLCRAKQHSRSCASSSVGRGSSLLGQCNGVGRSCSGSGFYPTHSRHQIIHLVRIPKDIFYCTNISPATSARSSSVDEQLISMLLRSIFVFRI